MPAQGGGHLRSRGCRGIAHLVQPVGESAQIIDKLLIGARQTFRQHCRHCRIRAARRITDKIGAQPSQQRHWRDDQQDEQEIGAALLHEVSGTISLRPNRNSRFMQRIFASLRIKRAFASTLCRSSGLFVPSGSRHPQTACAASSS
ncbi:MAG TPA: hypothetical protein DCP71_13810 [Verrucomicrobiales bacterium]|nr:hypothetical protein [Verrucomicrobiales bacterium]